MAEEFDLVTDWRLDAPLAAVWATLRDVEAWPGWWASVRRVETLEAGGREGVGAIHRLTWQTALPYRLTLATEVTAVEPMRRIAVRATGDVEGTGLWTLASAADGATAVRYVWRVGVTKPWMRAMLPVLKPAFAWNHGKVMAIGGEGLRRHLARMDLVSTDG
jgi:uncharacterized protein YndB with AHSA1/START domain